MRAGFVPLVVTEKFPYRQVVALVSPEKLPEYDGTIVSEQFPDEPFMPGTMSRLTPGNASSVADPPSKV